MAKKDFILIPFFATLLFSCSYKKIEKYKSGAIKSIGRMSNGDKTGDWVHFKENGDTLKINVFETGELRLEIHFFNNRPHSKNYFEKGIKILQKTYFQNGQLSCCINFKGDIQHGLSECFHPNGQLKSTYNFLDGVPHEKAQEFWPDGLSKLKTDNIGNGIHFFRDSIGNEAIHYMINFKQVDSIKFFTQTN